MRAKYITIEREYGSGGTKIARRAAEETGIPCYGHEILEEVSRKYQISIEEINQYEETVTNSFLYSIYLMAQSSSGKTDMLSKEGHIFVAEQAVIQEMARRGRSIFLGHCASEALKGQPGVIRVFIRCQNEEQKKQWIREDHGIEDYMIENTKKHHDRRRSNYFCANTGRKWEDSRSYDIVLDSGILGIEGSVSVLKSLLTE